MKADRVFVGDIKKCTKYERHDVFSSSTYIGDECIGCDSFCILKEEKCNCQIITQIIIYLTIGILVIIIAWIGKHFYEG